MIKIQDQFYFELNSKDNTQLLLAYFYDPESDSFCTAKAFGCHIETLDDHLPLDNFPFHLFDLDISPEEFKQWIRDGGAE